MSLGATAVIRPPGGIKRGNAFAYWGFLVVVQREREEKPLIGYGFFQSPLGTHEKLASETS